jgi:hypothetical protein
MWENYVIYQKLPKEKNRPAGEKLAQKAKNWAKSGHRGPIRGGLKGLTEKKAERIILQSRRCHSAILWCSNLLMALQSVVNAFTRAFERSNAHRNTLVGPMNRAGVKNKQKMTLSSFKTWS